MFKRNALQLVRPPRSWEQPCHPKARLADDVKAVAAFLIFPAMFLWTLHFPRMSYTENTLNKPSGFGNIWAAKNSDTLTPYYEWSAMNPFRVIYWWYRGL
eukprot:TRINITY_DN816_c0_g1_i1.p2 TRINITY_DN816_c0_g1~~TRINITY_DN816_c0_g1_i1.p2  ORF type:complete len:108 (-),score=25.65 TRINITY_DN816_c0_g1_i1:41-340(-)